MESDIFHEKKPAFGVFVTTCGVMMPCKRSV